MLPRECRSSDRNFSKLAVFKASPSEQSVRGKMTPAQLSPSNLTMTIILVRSWTGLAVSRLVPSAMGIFGGRPGSLERLSVSTSSPTGRSRFLLRRFMGKVDKSSESSELSAVEEEVVVWWRQARVFPCAGQPGKYWNASFFAPLNSRPIQTRKVCVTYSSSPMLCQKLGKRVLNF